MVRNDALLFQRLAMPALGALALSLAAACGSGRASTARPAVVPPRFELAVVAHIPHPRELAFLPNGDLLVGTLGERVFLLPRPERGDEPPRVFAVIHDAPDASVSVGDGAVYVGTRHGVWRIEAPRDDRASEASPRRIAELRPLDQGGHRTTSVAFDRTTQTLYASVGSSCNACTENDPTRATIQAMRPDGGGMHPIAARIRNAIALAIDPATHQLWAGNAGQDSLPAGHPYEFFDPVTAHAGVANYGWPTCEENHVPVNPGDSCAGTVIPRVVFPAYETPIGAVFYPPHQRGAHAFGAAYQGGAFVALHGSWHEPLRPPMVVFVPMSLAHPDEPRARVNWNDPTTQWHAFIGGFQDQHEARSGRPTGIAVGPDGSLFVADDFANAIYRVRPTPRARQEH